MTPATLTALAASLRLISDPQLAAMDRQALTQAAAILEQVAGADAGPVASVYTMEALVPGGRPVSHVSLQKELPAGTKLYTLAALTAAQARAEAVEWISVDERLPEFGEHVLCCYPTLGDKGGQPIQAVLFLDEEFGKWFFGCDDDMEGSFMPYEPTHWRPLPPPPATDSAIGGKGA